MNMYVATRHPAIFRKLGWAGFAFFFVKGMLWVLAPFVFAWFI
jgi:hypothetical protein